MAAALDATQLTIYYTDDAVRDVLLNGISDVDIRREALSADGMQRRPVNEVIAFIENKETARNANPFSGLSSMSAYRRTYRNQGSIPTEKPMNQNRPSPTLADRERKAQCPDCGK